MKTKVSIILVCLTMMASNLRECELDAGQRDQGTHYLRDG